MTEGVEFDTYNNNAVIRIPLGEDSNNKFSFGVRKAQSILNYIEDIKEFVKKNMNEEKE